VTALRKPDPLSVSDDLYDMPEGRKLVLISPTLLISMVRAMATLDGKRLKINWGDPVMQDLVAPKTSFYIPTITLDE
jgi:hypothetical protein